jgi:hypothetical protein
MNYDEVYGYNDDYSNKSHKIIWVIIFGAIVIGVFLGAYFIVASFTKNTVSENKLVQGSSLELEPNNSVKLKFGDGDHNLNVDFVGLDSVDITIHSEPIKITLEINEVKNIDLDNDGIADLRVKLVNIKNGKAIIAVKKIGKEICEEKWECSEWDSCSNEKQKRDCKDSNNCGTTFDKPNVQKECLNSEFVYNESAFDNGRRGNEEGNLTRNETRDMLNESLNKTGDLNETFENLNNSFEDGRDEENLSDHESLNDTNPSWDDFFGEPYFNSSCDKDFNKFVEASKTCSSYETSCNSEMDLFGIGVVQSFGVNYKIKGFSEDERCIFYFEYTSANVTLTDKFINYSLDKGSTMEEINNESKVINDDAQYWVGKNSTCYYPLSDLSEMISGWNAGNYSISSTDADIYDCVGSIYEVNVVSTEN